MANAIDGGLYIKATSKNLSAKSIRQNLRLGV